MADSLLTEKIKELVNVHVLLCDNCRPWVDHDYWAEISTDVYDVLLELDNDRDEIKASFIDISCPNCGSRFESPYDSVMLKTAYELQVDAMLEKIASPEIKSDLKRFGEHLATYPYLGLLDPMGKKILDGLSNLKPIKISDETWYRARLLNVENRLFKGDEMWAPDASVHQVPEGRYNHTGQSYLYLANDPKTAFSEVRNKDQDFCVIQKLRLKNIEKILDVREDEDMDVEANIYALAVIYTSQLTKKFSGNGSWKAEYLVPRFVADVAKHLGFTGIKFTSVYFGENLTLFNPQKSEVLFEGDSYLYQHEKEAFPPF